MSTKHIAWLSLPSSGGRSVQGDSASKKINILSKCIWCHHISIPISFYVMTTWNLKVFCAHYILNLLDLQMIQNSVFWYFITYATRVSDIPVLDRGGVWISDECNSRFCICDCPFGAWFGLVWLHGISTIVGYLMPNPFYTCISNIWFANPFYR